MLCVCVYVCMCVCVRVRVDISSRNLRERERERERERGREREIARSLFNLLLSPFLCRSGEGVRGRQDRNKCGKGKLQTYSSAIILKT